jgi:GTPase
LSTGFDRESNEFARGARAIVVLPDQGGSARDADSRLEETAGLAPCASARRVPPR